MKTTREIQQEKIKEELEPLQRIEKLEEERKNGIVRRGSFVWVPDLRTSSGVRFGYWRKAREGEIMREFKIWGGSVNELRGL